MTEEVGEDTAREQAVGEDAIELEESPDPLAERIKLLEQEKTELHDRWLRKQAEFENFRRRVTREKSEIRENSRAEILNEVLTVIDSCHRGLDTFSVLPSDDPQNSYLVGYEMLLKSLEDVLKRCGVEAVAGVGSEFDPNFHEAVIREETAGHPEGQILEEFRKGYQLNGRLLRASQVKVAVEPAAADSGA